MVSGLILLPQCIICTERVRECFCPLVRASSDSTTEGGRIVKLPLNERIKIGRRLLSVSRENLRRIFILSYAYRMTGKSEFLKRAESEMLKAASFSDWNPSHFLDVGEMTMALAIGYDWLYPQLSVQTKKEIENAIVEKGLRPSFDERYNWFVNAVHNWS